MVLCSEAIRGQAVDSLRIRCLLFISLDARQKRAGMTTGCLLLHLLHRHSRRFLAGIQDAKSSFEMTETKDFILNECSNP